MTISINASAATSDGVLSGDTARNEISTLGTPSADGTSYNDKNSLPAFRAGDVLQFDVSDLTADKTLTLISYKYGYDSEHNLEHTNSTVQYINEYTIAADSTTQTIEYKVRDIDDGIYKIVINGNDGKEVANFYYKVGTPKVSIVTGAEGTDYYVKEGFEQYDGSTLYSVAFVGKVTIGSGDVSFEDVALQSAGLAFNLKNKNTGAALYEDLTEDQLSKILPEVAEINGSLTIYFGVTMFKIPEGDLDQIKATPRLDYVTME